MEMSELLIKYGSDKCKEHSYELLYDQFFRNIGDHPIDFLEIGVQYGGSLMAWKDYFPKAKVTGIDIKDQRKWKRPDVEMVVIDVKKYIPDREFDVIIEDGSHNVNDQIFVALNFPKYLKKYGTLFIEDVRKDLALNILDALNKGLKGGYIVSCLDLTRIKDKPDDYIISIQKQ